MAKSLKDISKGINDISKEIKDNSIKNTKLQRDIEHTNDRKQERKRVDEKRKYQRDKLEKKSNKKKRDKKEKKEERRFLSSTLARVGIIISALFASAGTAIVASISAVIAGITAFVLTNWDMLKNYVGMVYDDVNDFITRVGNTLSKLGNIVSNFANEYLPMKEINGVVKAIKDMFQDIMDYVTMDSDEKRLKKSIAEAKNILKDGVNKNNKKELYKLLSEIATTKNKVLSNPNTKDRNELLEDIKSIDNINVDEELINSNISNIKGELKSIRDKEGGTGFLATIVYGSTKAMKRRKSDLQKRLKMEEKKKTSLDKLKSNLSPLTLQLPMKDDSVSIIDNAPSPIHSTVTPETNMPINTQAPNSNMTNNIIKPNIVDESEINQQTIDAIKDIENEVKRISKASVDVINEAPKISPIDSIDLENSVRNNFIDGSLYHK